MSKDNINQSKLTIACPQKCVMKDSAAFIMRSCERKLGVEMRVGMKSLRLASKNSDFQQGRRSRSKNKPVHSRLKPTCGVVV